MGRHFLGWGEALGPARAPRRQSTPEPLRVPRRFCPGDDHHLHELQETLAGLEQTTRGSELKTGACRVGTMRYLPASNVQSLFHGKGMRLLVVEAVPVGHHHVGAAPGLADRAHDEHTLEAVGCPS